MKLRRLKRVRTSSPAFETELALEILKSDKLRVSILLGILGSVVPLMLVLAVFSYEDFQRAFRGNFKTFLLTVLLVIGAALTSLIFEWLAINRRIKEQQTARPFFQYLSAFI